MGRRLDLGVLPKERLRRIPARLRVLHEATFFFHDLTVSAVKQYHRPDLRRVTVKPSALARIPDEELASLEGIDILRRIGRDAEAQRIMVNECILALISDALNFVCESLFSYEKGKLATSLSLIRKPMKENLLYLEWIVTNEAEFFHAFSSSNRREVTIGAIQPDKRRAIIEGAVARLFSRAPINADLLYLLRYDRSSAMLEPLWHKATHLVTMQNINFTTEPENFNMIFADEKVRRGIYDALADKYLLLVMYLYSISVTALSKLHPLHAGTIFYNELCCLVGTALITRRWSSIRGLMAEAIAAVNEHLSCGKCGTPMHVTERTLGRCLFSQTLTCRVCNEDNDCDLYKIMRLRRRHSNL